ncbi:Senescence regulator [Trema orientale]|uniref:Senescence regulator n=1 Tax=Trema orientale TaxID=63057 RepID=A0A2P5EER9_TREOI|nr:Senescence regulator [Trema orientale]
MAKGRKLTSSRSERLLGSGYNYGHSQGSSGTESSELGEEDVWSMVDDNAAERADHAPNGDWGPSASEAVAEGMGNLSIRNRRRIHRDDRHVGGLSLAFDSTKTASSRIVHQFRGNDGVASSSPRGHHMATSAPVNVPDWSKILRVDSVDSLHELDDGLEDFDSEMVPPHEYLAREYAHSRKTAANSVFEGVGRTLKGRDMSRVRDAVWRQTGFDG